MKYNPNTIITVALSYAEITELLEACIFAEPMSTDFDNPSFKGARIKLQRSVRPTKASNDPNHKENIA